jgi:hypothetical protein
MGLNGCVFKRETIVPENLLTKSYEKWKQNAINFFEEKDNFS